MFLILMEISVLNLNDIKWSSRQVPVGNDSPIDIASLGLDTPIWISPPAKVKHLGVITKIITSFYQDSDTSPVGYIDGLGEDLATPTTSLSTLLSTMSTTISQYGIQIYNKQAILLGPTESSTPPEPTLEIPVRRGSKINWQELFNTIIDGEHILHNKKGEYINVFACLVIASTTFG